MNITAVAQRFGGWWAVHIPEVDGAFTQTRRLDQVADMAAEAVAMILGLDPSTIDVTVEPHTGKDSLIAQAREARDAADRAADEASRVMRQTAREPVADGLTVRDVGRVMGVSHQRVSQLVS